MQDPNQKDYVENILITNIAEAARMTTEALWS